MQILKRIFSLIVILGLLAALWNASVLAVNEPKHNVSEDQTDGAADTQRLPQDVSTVLQATMSRLASSVTEPSFGTNAGEWTVLCLARGEYYAQDAAYFADYYERIVSYVNEKAAKVDMNGALHKSKSTDNSRLILALSSIGKDAAAVGDWNLISPYDDFDWIKKQGTNGVIFALLALDSNSYQTSDASIRQQCIDYLLQKQLADGGWALSGKTFNSDITGMTLQALYPYRHNSEVAAAASKAFACLSENQLATGGFLYGTGETSESAAQVIVACATWGINPDTDPRFIKNGLSAVDNLLSYYVEQDHMFAHQGQVSNDMATDQACYALVAYDRLLKGKTPLYDCSDLRADSDASDTEEMSATLSLPTEVNLGDTFNAVVSVNRWDNEAGYKLIDLLVTVPNGVSVSNVSAGSRLAGGTLSWNLEEASGKLRIVYFDANENQTLTVSGYTFPAELFHISFKAERVREGSGIQFSLTGMSAKLSSDSADTASMVVVNTQSESALVQVVTGISFSAKCLYVGDDVDLISSDTKAVAIAVTGISEDCSLRYHDGSYAVDFRYSAEITAKTGIATYVALVGADIPTENFVKEEYLTLSGASADAVSFGDSNGDGVVNAQDALAVVDAWLRKGDAPNEAEILAMNVNGDSRVNTFDALGIVEAFVNGSDYGVVTKAASIAEYSK